MHPVEKAPFILPTTEYNDMCSLSLETLKSLAEKNDLVITQCFHKFCHTDLSRWLQHETTCPLCKRKVTEEECIPVTLQKVKNTAHEVLPSHIHKKHAREPAVSEDDESFRAAIRASLEDEDKANKLARKVAEINGPVPPEEAFQRALHASQPVRRQEPVVVRPREEAPVEDFFSNIFPEIATILAHLS